MTPEEYHQKIKDNQERYNCKHPTDEICIRCYVNYDGKDTVC